MARGGWRRLLRRGEPGAPNDRGAGRDHAVIVHLKLSDDGFGGGGERAEILALDDRLVEAVSASGLGEYDGNELGGGEAVLYAYGTDADALFAVMSPLLDGARPAEGSYVVKRHGAADDPGAREEIVVLG